MKFSNFNLSTTLCTLAVIVVALTGSSSNSNTFITTTNAQAADNNNNDVVRNKNDIPMTAINAGIFTTLVAALSATDLVGALSSPAGPFTVFAPTDDAFDLLPDGLVECLLEEDNLSILSDILLYHVASGEVGEVLSTDLSNGMTIPTLLQGQNVVVDLNNGNGRGVKINDSTVTTADVLATNGVIHIINEVLVPPSVDVAAFLTTCGDGDGNDSGSGSPSLVDIPTTAVNAGIFNTLVAALGAADLVEAVSSPNGLFTVFAPTDAAFSSLPDELVPCLLENDNKSVLSDILLYHVVSGKTLSTGLTDGMNIPTLLQRQSIVVDLSNGSGVKINDSTVTTPDILATNGVIHSIDQVLVPPSVNVAAFLSTCYSEPVVVDVVSEDCIYSGVWRSANQWLTGPTHTCLCTHGGHWINCRINTPSDIDQTQTQTSTTTNSLVDIPTTAINAGIFTTLVAALSATDLVDALSEPNGPFTVFAPNDDAFNALPDGLVGCLLEENNLPILSDILLYHVTSGKALSTDLSNGQQISTLLDGGKVTVDLNNSGVKINESNVIGADVLVSNGVIHIIDAVLVPSQIDVGAFLQTCRTNSSAITGPVTTATANSNSNQSIEQFSGGLESDTSLLSASSSSTSMSSGSADSITNESIIGQFGVMESNTSSSSSSLYSFSFLISFVSTIITLVVLY